jgi:hypothetical protein
MKKKTAFLSTRVSQSLRRKVARDAVRAGHGNVSILLRAIVEQHYKGVRHA